MNINDFKNKDGDVNGVGYEFIGNRRQIAYDSKSYVKKKHDREKKYLDFVLNPDIEEPIRMPSDFTYPTNIIDINATFGIRIGTAGDFHGFFAPQNQMVCEQSNASDIPYSNSTAAVSSPWVFYSRNLNEISPYTNSYSFMVREPISANTTIADLDRKNSQLNRFRYYNEFKTVRCIAGVCELEYIGPLEETAGVINVGATVVPASRKGAGHINSPTISQLHNLLINKQYKVSTPIRVTWFPVDQSVQSFCTTNPFLAPTSTSFPSMSQLIFYFNGVNLPAGSVINVKIKMFYEAVPHVQFSSLFKPTQGYSCEDKDVAWDLISAYQRQGLDQLLMSVN